MFVAFVPPRRRRSYDLEREGKPPAFVLEVISPESTARDLREKPLAYDYIGVQEYALFDPSPESKTPIRGFRRRGDRFTSWLPDQQGRLYSEALDLRLFMEPSRYGPLLHAETPQGERLPTLQESEAARKQYEAEAAKLRAELERRDREQQYT